MANGRTGPDLSPETLRRIEILFPSETREAAKILLYEQCGQGLPFMGSADMYKLERFRFAALKLSDGDIGKLERAVKLARRDWRDLLVAAGFAHHPQAHLDWEPKPADGPSEIDVPALASAIQERLARVLSPLGFARTGEKWSRGGPQAGGNNGCEIPQTLALQTGLASRIEVCFFVRVSLDAPPMGILLQLPKLPRNFVEPQGKGYFFRSGGNAEELCSAIAADVRRFAVPLFQRFTSSGEIQRGFDDGTFHPNLRLENHALIF